MVGHVACMQAAKKHQVYYSSSRHTPYYYRESQLCTDIALRCPYEEFKRRPVWQGRRVTLAINTCQLTADHGEVARRFPDHNP